MNVTALLGCMFQVVMQRKTSSTLGTRGSLAARLARRRAARASGTQCKLLDLILKNHLILLYQSNIEVEPAPRKLHHTAS